MKLGIALTILGGGLLASYLLGLIINFHTTSSSIILVTSSVLLFLGIHRITKKAKHERQTQ